MRWSSSLSVSSTRLMAPDEDEDAKDEDDEEDEDPNDKRAGGASDGSREEDDDDGKVRPPTANDGSDADDDDREMGADIDDGDGGGGAANADTGTVVENDAVGKRSTADDSTTTSERGANTRVRCVMGAGMMMAGDEFNSMVSRPLRLDADANGIDEDEDDEDEDEEGCERANSDETAKDEEELPLAFSCGDTKEWTNTTLFSDEALRSVLRRGALANRESRSGLLDAPTRFGSHD